MTQEMIDDYHARQNQPVVIAGVTYKYHPVEFDLEEFVEKPVLSQVQKQEIEQLYPQIVADIEINLKMIERLQESKFELSTNFDIEMGKLEVEKAELMPKKGYNKKE